MKINPIAAKGFGIGTGDYERARPDYPADAVAHLIGALELGRETILLDLAAGTGKLTNQLTEHVSTTIAVEPLDSMRAVLSRTVPRVQSLAGTAEAIPLDDQSVDAVTVGQAFHWFDAPRAIAEIHRVLKSGGGLGLIWNLLDTRRRWVLRAEELTEPKRKGVGRMLDSGWRSHFDRTSAFEPLVERWFEHRQLVDRETVLARYRSKSFIAAMDPPDQEDLMGAIGGLLDGDPETRDRELIEIPYRTVVFCTRAVSADSWRG
ncbi:MAG TPA: class I SAM-dependent methyltransferase, partial [Actinomycetota bacterium]|nr:class I SAM-dependent methyltransferase [Actinomycetota bacterium]